jgi:mono/diheme cytochrome c family protein
MMERTSLLGIAVAATLASLLVVGPARSVPDAYTAVERGRYLTILGDCVACHTAPGGKPFAGGRDLATPFGVIMTPNLTPDGATGIGRWTAADFYRAMHEGKRPDGARLYPAFPYTYYTKVSRADSDDIFAYLQTLEPAPNSVDRNTLPFPFNIRTVMLGWNLLFFKPGEFTPDPARSAEFNRGAYLVEGLGHCGACHTPMNNLGANKASHAYEGNVIQGWVAPNITNDDRVGIGRWSVEDVVGYLQTGHGVQSAASGPMAEVITNSTALMNQADLRAIAVYLKERGAAGDAAPTAIPASDPQMQAGAAIYRDTCMACHTGSGAGVNAIFPKLAGSAVVQQSDPTTLVRVVVQGSKSAATGVAPTGPGMPSLGWRLSDEQVANVLTYIRNDWGNRADRVSGGDVASIKKKL